MSSLEEDYKKIRPGYPEVQVERDLLRSRVKELEGLIIDYCADHCDGAPDGGHADGCLYREAFPLGRD